MNDGSMILVAGALLAAGIVAALAAGRLRVPGLVISLGLGMLIGSDGLGVDPFLDYELARTIGVIALALILFEGGLAAGWKEIRPVLGTSISLATIGTLITALIVGVAARSAARLQPARGLPARVDRRRDRQRGDLLGAARVHAQAPAGARSLEGESGFNDPVAIVLVIGFIDWIQKPDYGLRATCSAWSRSSSRSARRSGLVVGRLAVIGVPAASASLRPASIRSRRSPRRRSPSAEPPSCTARASSPSTWRGCRSEALAIPARRTVDDFHAGARVGRPDRGLLHVRAARVPERPARRRRRGAADRRRARCSSPVRSRRSLATRFGALQHARGAYSSAGPACAGRSRSCSRPSP